MNTFDNSNLVAQAYAHAPAWQPVLSRFALPSRFANLQCATLPADTLAPCPSCPDIVQINAVFAVSSWTSAARSSAISNGVNSGKVSVSFTPDARLDHFAFRLHEIAFANRKEGVPMEKSHWNGEDEHGPLKGVELAALVLALVNAHVDLGACEAFERDLERVSEDLEAVLLKGAKEWLAVIS